MSALAQLGPYRIVRLIGRGGMGEVYEAVHTGLDKRVALKVLPRQMAAARLDRFLREARLAAGLQHTNIVPVFDVGVADGTPYYAMQYIAGRPLGGASGVPFSLPGSTTATPGTRSFDPDRTTDHVPSPVPHSDIRVLSGYCVASSVFKGNHAASNAIAGQYQGSRVSSSLKALPRLSEALSGVEWSSRMSRRR